MTAWFVAPLVVAIAAAVMTSSVAPRHWPRAVTTLLTALALVAAVSWAGSSIIIAIAYLIEHTPVHDLVAWCPALADHHVTHWLGAASTFSAAFSLANFARWALARRRREMLTPRLLKPLVVTQTDRPCAYAVPGNPGSVVVSTGMLRRLNRDDRRVLLAHEQAHLRHRHHLFVDAASFASMVLPLLRPMNAAIRLAVESWADEEAVRHVGNRKIVAKAIAKAGLIQNEFPAPAGQLAMAGGDVASRVQRLVAEPVSGKRRVAAGTILMLPLVVTLLSAAVQMHHVVAFAEHVCT